MPVPKRYSHISQELNNDPEGWELTSTFGDRSIRTLVQIVVYLDRYENKWRLTGDWAGTLSRTVRQSVANVSRQVRWMIAKGWLRVLEVAADGSPLVLEAPNWWKYNRRQEHKWNASAPDTGADRDPLLSFPTPSLSVPTPKIEEKKRKEKKTDAASPSAVSKLESFSITPELEAWAKSEGIINPGLELDEFKDYWRSVGGKRAGGKVITDWDATFRNRLRELKAANKLKASNVWEA